VDIRGVHHEQEKREKVYQACQSIDKLLKEIKSKEAQQQVQQKSIQ